MDPESDRTSPIATTTSCSFWRNALIAVGVAFVAYALASMYYISDTRTKLASLEKADAATNESLKREIKETEIKLTASTEALAQRIGMSQQDLQTRMASRTAQLEKQQMASEQRYSQTTEEHKRQLGQVSGEVANVRSELGGTKTDLAAARTDIDATKQKLERTIGDLGMQSGLIARTREDLEELRHRGDRNYYEFSLQKNGSPTPIANISLQLKKADQKRHKFTLNVFADDNKIEKKDRTIAEPMQLITGRDRQLYEIVVFTVDKNKITGYVSVPKSLSR
jgi:chromosome segregation ATPase